MSPSSLIVILGVMTASLRSRGLCAVILLLTLEIRRRSSRSCEKRTRFHEISTPLPHKTSSVFDRIEKGQAEDRNKLPVGGETSRVDDVREDLQPDLTVSDAEREHADRWRDVTSDVAGGKQNGEEPVDWTKQGESHIRVIEVNQTLYLNNSGVDDEQQFQPVRMPDKFENYDVDGDGRITLSELRYVTGATEGAAEAFSAADVDGDGLLDEEEFQATMWGRDASEPQQRTVILMPSEDVRPSEIPRVADSPPVHPPVQSSRPPARWRIGRAWSG
ncbi:uncharacterized protein LOC112571836 isoform X2 [Pomacea canaliculata]|uniref:uncharacterized protein LOC112571836 isoform X2 n=1 Tax=Pomacea canaliculata TaxID=400727 RepID=UPI000D73AB01|nr:uncharacterized protein LOC112571836 isoform X2 [Pomacea canaliculata]